MNKCRDENEHSMIVSSWSLSQYSKSASELMCQRCGLIFEIQAIRALIHNRPVEPGRP